MEFDKETFKVYTWKNWMMIHWILNPGLAINELLLGQRVPKLTLENITSNKTKFERIVIPCPHCKVLHDGRTWSTESGTAFKNWFGLYCKNCGKTIPCLLNAFSLIILIITFPLWGWFKKSLKSKWLDRQPDRYKNIDIGQIKNPFHKKKWVVTGLSWGIIMFVIMSVGYPYFSSEEITLKSLSLGIGIWTIGGLSFGYSMKIYMNKRVTL